MSEVRTFWTSDGNTWHDNYQLLNEQINEYADKNNLIIKSIQYDKLSNSIIANVIFSNIPNELFVL